MCHFFRLLVLALLAFLLTVSGFAANPMMAQPSTLLSELTGPNQLGFLVYGSVRLDGRDLFQVAAAKTSNSEGDWRSSVPLASRIQTIENRLQRLLHNLLKENATLQEDQIKVSKLNEQTIVQADLETISEPLTLVTITRDDTEVYGLPVSELANLYATQIYEGLALAIAERQPEAIHQKMWLAIGAILVALVLNQLLLFLKRRSSRYRSYRDQLQEINQQLNDIDPHQGSYVFNQENLLNTLRKAQFDLERKLSNFATRRHVLLVTQGSLWLICISYLLRLFPTTRTLGILLIHQPTWIVLTWLGIIALLSLSHIITDKLLSLWVQKPDPVKIHHDRKEKRLPTLSRTLKGVETILLVVIGIILTTQILSLFTGFELLASVGVFGVAASIAFQSAIQDTVNGCMLLIRDAYTVGDVIEIATGDGYVENMNLMMTQMRNSAGALITVRHSDIATVHNLTREWSRMDLEIEVAYEADADQALQIMQAVFDNLKTDPAWGDRLWGEPDILGIEGLAHSGVRLKIRTKTAPIQQWNVSREYLRRLKVQLTQAGICMGTPHQILQFDTSIKLGELNPEK